LNVIRTGKKTGKTLVLRGLGVKLTGTTQWNGRKKTFRAGSAGIATEKLASQRDFDTKTHFPDGASAPL
jgi:hypothetical protein